MRVNEIIKESLYDYFANRQQQKTARKSMAPGYQGAETQAFAQTMNPFYKDKAEKEEKRLAQQAEELAAQQAAQQAAADAEKKARALVDITLSVPDGKQFKFQNPDNPGGFIIIRQDGYYVDSLPRHLQGQVKPDPKSKLYPVLRPENIQLYNLYYNAAADKNRVKEEPIYAL